MRLFLSHSFAEDNLDPGALSDQQVADWFREKIRGGVTEQQLIAEFGAYEHDELIRGGAEEDEVKDYETADPSYMAVPAALRYWTKYHAESITGLAL